jgi:hypothetical protein
MRNEARKFAHPNIEQVLHLTVREFIEVEESKRASLWFGGCRNPDCKLIRLELRYPQGGIRGDRFFWYRAWFGLEITARNG